MKPYVVQCRRGKQFRIYETPSRGVGRSECEIFRKLNSRCVTVFFALFFFLALCGCGKNSDDADGAVSQTSVTLALNWYAEAEHGGYVAADKLGLFQQSNLDVTIQQGGPGAPNLVIQELAAGRIEFAVSSADLVVLARAKGVPIVAVAAPLQNSPRCIMVHEASGIKTLYDLANVELAISESRPFALWMKRKLPLKNVTMVPFNGLVGEFIQKPNFAQQAFVFSEPFVARENGADPRVLMLSEIGYNPYSSLLVTTEDIIREQPELVRQVVNASVAGWKSYLNNPDEVNAAIHKDNQDMSLASLKFGVETMKPLSESKAGAALCDMQPERWAVLIQQIEELGEIEIGSVKPEQCFNTSFLPGLTSSEESLQPAE